MLWQVIQILFSLQACCCRANSRSCDITNDHHGMESLWWTAEELAQHSVGDTITMPPYVCKGVVRVM